MFCEVHAVRRVGEHGILSLKIFFFVKDFFWKESSKSLAYKHFPV
jgi:hypothetical protein